MLQGTNKLELELNADANVLVETQDSGLVLVLGTGRATMSEDRGTKNRSLRENGGRRKKNRRKKTVYRIPKTKDQTPGPGPGSSQQIMHPYPHPYPYLYPYLHVYLYLYPSIDVNININIDNA